jgi:hypothetical protein
MVKLTPRRRWRGPALGGRLQRGCRFCFAAHDGEVTTSKLAKWLRPEIVYSGGKPSRWRMRSHRRALKSIGAVKIRRIGRSEWVWRLKRVSHTAYEKTPSKIRRPKANKTRHFACPI